jgi:hypothetical protein
MAGQVAGQVAVTKGEAEKGEVGKEEVEKGKGEVGKGEVGKGKGEAAKGKGGVAKEVEATPSAHRDTAYLLKRPSRNKSRRRQYRQWATRSSHCSYGYPRATRQPMRSRQSYSSHRLLGRLRRRWRSTMTLRMGGCST